MQPSFVGLPSLNLLFVFLLFSMLTSVASFPPYDTIKSSILTCVFPVSGTYGLLQRLNYYLMLIFAACVRRRDWLVGGAYAAFMSFVGISVVHAITLAFIYAPYHKNTGIDLNSSAFDIDIMGTWCILAPAVILFNPMMAWSPSLNGSQARPVLRVWAVFVVIGTVCAFAALSRAYPDALPCNDIDNDPSIRSCTTICAGFIDRPHRLRGSSELTPVPKSRVFGKLFTYVYALGIITICVSFATLLTCFFETPQVPSSHDPLPVARRGGKTQRCRTWVAGACIPLFALSLAFNEAYLLAGKQRLPVKEEVYAVGQWGSWVASALVVTAAVVLGYGNSNTITAKTDSEDVHQQALIRVV